MTKKRDSGYLAGNYSEEITPMDQESRAKIRISNLKNKEQVYSLDNEIYYSYDDVMSDLRDIFDIGKEAEVWEADKVEWSHADFINVDDLIYNMQTNAMDACGEVAEEYLDDFDDENKRDNLKNYIAEWLKKNSKLGFYGVENEKKIVVVVE